MRGRPPCVSQTSRAASKATMTPITTSMVIASLSWKPRSQGDTLSVSPATRLSYSSQTTNAASAEIDSR